MIREVRFWLQRVTIVSTDYETITKTRPITAGLSEAIIPPTLNGKKQYLIQRVSISHAIYKDGFF